MISAKAIQFFARSFLVLAIAGVWTGSSITSSKSYTEPSKTWRFTCYAYRDINRSGVFDMGDRPYAKMRIQITRPDGSTVVSRSNINGFTPFIVSKESPEEAAIFETGKYEIQMKPPKGFVSTSKMDRQTVEFVGQTNARGRLVPTSHCQPIGIAPILSVRGKIETADGTAPSDIALFVSRGGNAATPVRFGENGNFQFVGDNGNWLLEVKNGGGETLSKREFKIDGLPVHLSTIRLSKEPASKSAEENKMLGFDDLIISDTLFEIPSGYGDLGWLNWISTHTQFYRGAGYVNLTTSSEYMAYNSSGLPGLMFRNKPFDFVGTNVGVAWPRGEEEDVIFTAWNGEKMVYQDRVPPSDNGPVHFDANYNNITKLEIRSGNYERVVIDDFLYR